MNTEPQTTSIPVQGDFPPATLPTLYVDGISSIAPSPFVVKFYLARIEPHLRAENKSLIQPFAQMVMPMDGFLQTAMFFENVVKNLLAQGTISQQQVDVARSLAGGPK